MECGETCTLSNERGETMKQLECPKCKKAHTIEQWDKATQEAFGKEAESVTDYIVEPSKRIAHFVCPSCHRILDFVYENLRVVY
jgi:predicted RNA-binding Zn-ribbon protein involved in translation (DUF1610 family)